jgi:UDP-N-acetylmuramoyl-L-alanyl-D-glutamate--2,6-diaminopimelate ligase
MSADRREVLRAALLAHGAQCPCRHPVTHLTVDSREVGPGSAFVAIRGARVDGHGHVGDAVARGARLVVVEPGASLPVDPARLPEVDVASVPDTRRFAREVAAPFHGHPTRALEVVAVTGTNGKTTTAHVLERLLRAAGRNPGVVCTLGLWWNGQRHRHENHVPEPVTLQRLLARMRADGVDAVVLEVSSWALLADRLHGVALDAAVLTNVTEDHLDVHGTMEAYLRAKLGLFDLLALPSGGKPDPVAAVWAGTRHHDAVQAHLRGLGLRTRWFDTGAPADLRLRPRHAGLEGTRFDLLGPGLDLPDLRTRLVGEWNLRNVAGALAARLPWLQAQRDRLAELRARLDAALSDVVVPGRLERVPNDRGILAVVDYAHTPDALDQVLSTLAALPHRRLITMFGCGGDRDRAKRPLMGRVALARSDHVVVTSDNPRSEDPDRIIAEILAGVDGERSRCTVEPDREQAIRKALARVGPGDILLVAGKGHEDVQIIGAERRPFDDRLVLRRCL